MTVTAYAEQNSAYRLTHIEFDSNGSFVAGLKQTATKALRDL